MTHEMLQDVKRIWVGLTYVTQDLWEIGWKPGELPDTEQVTQRDCTGCPVMLPGGFTGS